MHSYPIFGKPCVRIGALPTDRFPSEGKAVSVFQKLADGINIWVFENFDYGKE